MSVLKLIAENIRDTRITNYLKNQGVTKSDDGMRMEISQWMSKLLDEERVTKEQLNDCFWKELMYGNRRFIRCYELKAVRKIKHEEDWNDFMYTYNCPCLNFNRILQTTMRLDEISKICAMKATVESGTIKAVSILFVYNMKIRNRTNGSIENLYSYIPVTFDLENNLLMLKVWNKDDTMEGDSPKEQLDYIIDKLERKLNFETKFISTDPQKVLYEMSKALFDEFFRNLPNNAEVEAKRASLPILINSLLEGISLSNVESEGNIKTMNPEVINVQDEMFKLLQQVALYDYLKDNNIKTLLENTDRYISRVRFSDRDNLTASLISETGMKCIFDAKTFMCVRNSLDLVEKIVSIVVSFTNNRSRGLLSVKYDASDKNYLSIHILNNRYYTEDDFKMIWELYKQYESVDNAETSTIYNENNVEAM